MKRLISILLLVLLLVTAVGCNNLGTEQEATLSPVEIARNSVIEKWNSSAGESGTAKYIEDIYKQYPDDDVISNIYFYCIAKDLYGYYELLDESKYLDQAIEYAAKIDPSYLGEFADEIHSFVGLLIPSEVADEIHDSASEKEDRYTSLTNTEKKKICEYIESRYEYYDSLNGGYSGDKYSDTIMQEAADKYGLTVTQIEIIWMNMYSY